MFRHCCRAAGRVHYTHHQFRFYATPNTPGYEHDPETAKLINAYPKHANPTPYELLNIPKSDHQKVTPKQLKRRFFELAKVYHPDTGTDHQHTKRFTHVLAAYTLLKNPLAKRNYDQYNIGWNDNSRLRTSPNMHDPTSQHWHRQTQTQRHRQGYAYEKGTWEDAYRYTHPRSDPTWTTSADGSVHEEIMANKNTIAITVIVTLLIYGALHLSQEYIFEHDIGGVGGGGPGQGDVHERSEEDLRLAYSNYGLGDSKQDRINRFLWWRKLTMAFSLQDVTEIINRFHAEKDGVVDETDSGDNTSDGSSNDCV